MAVPGMGIFTLPGDFRVQQPTTRDMGSSLLQQNGIAKLNIRSHMGSFNQGLSHADCTTTSGVQQENGEDTPSHTFFEALTICQNAG